MNEASQTSCQLTTSVTFGRLFGGSSHDEDQWLSLGSRLKARLRESGWLASALTLKRWAMPHGQYVYQLDVSEQNTSENDTFLWPTVTARDARTLKGGMDRPNRTGGKSLLQTLLDMGYQNGYLNPKKAGWLMGYPPMWARCEKLPARSLVRHL